MGNNNLHNIETKSKAFKDNFVPNKTIASVWSTAWPLTHTDAQVSNHAITGIPAVRRFGFPSNGPRRWSHQCKTQRTRDCNGGKVGLYELMSEMALGRRRGGGGGGQTWDKQIRGGEVGERSRRRREESRISAIIRLLWTRRQAQHGRVVMWREGGRGRPKRGALREEMRTKKIKRWRKRKRMADRDDVDKLGRLWIHFHQQVRIRFLIVRMKLLFFFTLFNNHHFMRSLHSHVNVDIHRLL